MTSQGSINKLFSAITMGVMALALVIGINVSSLLIGDGQSVYAAPDSGDHGSGGHGGKGGEGGKHGAGGKGGKGGHSAEDVLSDEGEDSDRPDWAGTPGREGKPGRGNPQSGTKKGDLFGDMYVLLRDDNGEPILSDAGFVQPIDADGNPIPLDEEGHIQEGYEDLAQEVEIGRLNVGRSPSHVLETRLNEVLKLIDGATAIATDEAGRLVVTTADGVKTIDSPLENLGLYVALMTDGKITVTDLPDSIAPELQALFTGTSTLTAADLAIASSLIAAASDKSIPMTIDKVVYVNSMVGLNDPDYVNFNLTDYDRSDTYSGVMVTILVEDPANPGTYIPKSVDIYQEVFGGVDYDQNSGVDVFTQQADDARAVINFIHDALTP